MREKQSEILSEDSARVSPDVTTANSDRIEDGYVDDLMQHKLGDVQHSHRQ